MMNVAWDIALNFSRYNNEDGRVYCNAKKCSGFSMFLRYSNETEGEVQIVGNLLHFHNKCIVYRVVFEDGVIQPIDIYRPQGKNGQEYRFHFKCLKFELTCKF